MFIPLIDHKLPLYNLVLLLSPVKFKSLYAKTPLHMYISFIYPILHKVEKSNL